MDTLTHGARLQMFRKHKKLSGEEFGEVINLSKQGVSHLEADRTKLTIVQLESLINKFPELNIYWLIAGKGEMLQDPELRQNAKAYWEMLQKLEVEHQSLLGRHQTLTEAHSIYFNNGPIEGTAETEE